MPTDDGELMATSSDIAPQVKLVFEKQTVEAAKQKGVGLAAPGRDLLIKIFKGHEEFLGWTPD
jgi:hypothetical protein